MAYEIEGRLLEVCTCNVLCPCWVGEDPDYKTCDTSIAWGIEKGSIEGVDVSGLTHGGVRPHPQEHPHPEVLEGGRVRRRARDRRAGGGAAPAVHRPARRRGRRPRRPDRRGRRGRARADHLQRRGWQGAAHDRHARRRRDGAVRRRDRQPDDARRDGLQHDPGLARSTPARPASTRATAAATASRAWTSRATTPSRATSGSRPDAQPIGRPMFASGHLRVPAAATGRSWSGRSALLAGAAWLALWLLGRLAVRPLPPPRGARPASLAARGRRCSSLGWVLMIVAMMLPTQRAAGRDVRGARRPAPPAGPAGRPARSPATSSSWAAFGLAAWLGDRGDPCRGRGASRGWPSIPQLILGGDPGRRRAVAVQPAARPLPRRVPQPARLRRRTAGAGRAERRRRSMGIAHGAFCVGCCWSLMLVMFGVGLGSLAGCSPSGR